MKILDLFLQTTAQPNLQVCYAAVDVLIAVYTNFIKTSLFSTLPVFEINTLDRLKEVQFQCNAPHFFKCIRKMIVYCSALQLGELANYIGNTFIKILAKQYCAGLISVRNKILLYRQYRNLMKCCTMEFSDNKSDFIETHI